VTLSPSFVQTIVLFVLMAIGFASGKARVLDETGDKGLSRLLVNIIVPALIIESMQRPFTPELRDFAFRMLGVSFLSYALAFALAAVLVWAIRAKGAERGAHAFGAVFANSAFMGFPVIEAILGKDSLFAASVANIPFNLLAFSVGPYILAKTAGGEVKLGIASFVNPAVVASVLGFCLFAFGVELPGPLIGALYATSVFRLVLLPLALYGALRAFGFSGLLVSMPVVLAAMPVAASSAILAEAYGGDAETASSLVLVSTLLSLITIPALTMFRFPT
jgi:hypothetical protein